MKKIDEVMLELHRVKAASAKEHKSIANYAAYLRSQEKTSVNLAARNTKVTPKAAVI